MYACIAIQYFLVQRVYVCIANRQIVRTRKSEVEEDSLAGGDVTAWDDDDGDDDEVAS